MLNDPIAKTQEKNQETFMSIRPYFDLNYFLRLYYITLEVILKAVLEPFKSNFGKLLYGSSAVVHS